MASGSPVRLTGDQAAYLVATAARAPSVHNTQPWLFQAGPDAIDLLCDPRRKLVVDPAGRELHISCGAALFGLRLAMRSQGYEPDVRLFPDPGRADLLARLTPRPGTAMSRAERELLAAIPYRHTHRGAFEPGPLPSGLLGWLEGEALTEHAALVIVRDESLQRRLASLTAEAERELDEHWRSRAETRRWTRDANSTDRDGVPAVAFAASPPHADDPRHTDHPRHTDDQRTTDEPPHTDAPPSPGEPPRTNAPHYPGEPPSPDQAHSLDPPHSPDQPHREERLPQRDFDLGRQVGRLSQPAGAPAATAVLVTPGDTPADWIRAGQALHRVLLRAAIEWVSATLHTQPMESAPIRQSVRRELGLRGMPQVALQFGLARTVRPTARRPVGEVLSWPLRPSG